jgi:hypothetical protein
VVAEPEFDVDVLDVLVGVFPNSEPVVKPVVEPNGRPNLIGLAVFPEVDDFLYQIRLNIAKIATEPPIMYLVSFFIL